MAIRILLLAIVVGASPGVFGQKPADQTAAAEALFREGIALMQKGRYREACDKFAASHRFEPSVGALLNLGNCREALGQIAAAHALFAQAEEAARQAGDEKRARYARTRKQALESRLPEKTSGEASTPDRPANDATSRAREKAPANNPATGRKTQDSGTARPVATAPMPVLLPRPSEPVAAGAHLLPDARMSEKGPSAGRRLVFWGGVVGAVGLAGGSALGWRARGLYHAARAVCDNSAVESCTDEERRLSRDGRARARDTADLATLSFAAGAAALSTGVVLWLVDRAGRSGVEAPIVPAVGPHSAAIRVQLRF